ncbi:MAG: hypothetical protein L0Y56_22545, partial [Nitrospira sp.]|nr:hypothetical protein [Nitrospira sp.]
KREYLNQIRERYKNADLKTKGAILTEFCAVCGYHRKYAIRLLSRGHQGGPKSSGRKRIYGPDLMAHIRELWFWMEQLSAVRMKRALWLWLKFYTKAADGTACTEVQKRQLRKMSASTLGRYLKELRAQKGISGTKTNWALKHKIPIEILNYKITKPGAMQADTVLHCGNKIAGNYAHSLTMTDIASGWTENRAIWTKDSRQVRDQMKSIEQTLPFNLHWLATDCGNEFLNHYVISYLECRRKPVYFSRSRPYHKDDNAFSEQKNWTHVRGLFGYDRIDQRELIPLMNEIYEKYWNPLHNFFFPSLKLIAKEVVNKKIKKKFDAPKTPAQRLLESEHLSIRQKRNLRQRYKQLNPFELKTEMEKKLKAFYRILRQSQFHRIAA